MSAPGGSYDLRGCLDAIAALATDGGITEEERALRLAQYAASAAGVWCPEVAFDPVATSLRRIAADLSATRAAGDTGGDLRVATG